MTEALRRLLALALDAAHDFNLPSPSRRLVVGCFPAPWRTTDTDMQQLVERGLLSVESGPVAIERAGAAYRVIDTTNELHDHVSALYRLTPEGRKAARS